MQAPIKRSATLFLQFVITLIGIGAGALLLWEPRLEGRNAHASLSQIYLHDPFLAYAYVAAVPFFVALYQACKLLGFIRQESIFSQAAVKALRTIKYCALSLIAFLGGAEAYFFIIQRSKDDIAGGVMLGVFLMFVFAVVATAAAVFEKTLQSAVDIKSEHDLTV